MPSRAGQVGLDVANATRQRLLTHGFGALSEADRVALLHPPYPSRLASRRDRRFGPGTHDPHQSCFPPGV
jgi:hypothetical protein